MTREVSIEDHLKSVVEKSGGLCIKLNPTGVRGIPDRLVVLPGAWIVFVEIKRPKGGVIGRLQYWWAKRLGDLGCQHRFVKTRDDVVALMEDYCCASTAFDRPK